MSKLAIVIVNYNVKFYLEQCLRSVEKSSEGIDVDVYVVDNNSSDGSLDYLRPRFPKVHFIPSNHNLGFACANNLAIRESTSQYVLLLNPDTVITERNLSDVIGFMDVHEHAGGVGVRMINADGTNANESRRGVPSPMTSFYKMSGLCRRYPRHKKFGHYYMSSLPWDKPERIEIISGAFCMLRRKAIDETGLLDESFFMYGEDIDLSFRLLKGGWENWYVPTLILHYKGESTEKTSFRYVHVCYKAMLIFFRKHYGGASLLLDIPIKIAIYAKALTALFGMMRKGLGFYSLKRSTVPNYVFFDVSHYSYIDILTIFAANHKEDESIGIYDPFTGKVITADGVSDKQ